MHAPNSKAAHIFLFIILSLKRLLDFLADVGSNIFFFSPLELGGHWVIHQQKQYNPALLISRIKISLPPQIEGSGGLSSPRYFQTKKTSTIVQQSQISESQIYTDGSERTKWWCPQKLTGKLDITIVKFSGDIPILKGRASHSAHCHDYMCTACSTSSGCLGQVCIFKLAPNIFLKRNLQQGSEGSVCTSKNIFMSSAEPLHLLWFAR